MIFIKRLMKEKKCQKKINPLFLTRGVPGTHDTKLLLNCLKIKKFYKKNFIYTKI